MSRVHSLPDNSWCNLSSPSESIRNATRRLFSSISADRIDELGFLDTARTARVVECDALFERPITWVLGAPWLGKTTVAEQVFAWVRVHPDALGGLQGRVCLSQFGGATPAAGVPPEWWSTWLAGPPVPAVWIVDGVDEGFQAVRSSVARVAELIDDLPQSHFGRLRLILFSRPNDELVDFRDALRDCCQGNGLFAPQQYWLTRLDRDEAQMTLGEHRFAEVANLIRANALQSIAGLPVVLNYLKKYRETDRLPIGSVWRGILISLLGEEGSNRRARFTSSPGDRFAAAARIAGVLTLTGRDTVRLYSPDNSLVTLSTVYPAPTNQQINAAHDVLHTSMFLSLPEDGSHRFARKNVQDWLTAFALVGVPLAKLRSLVTQGGRVAAHLTEPVRLLRKLTDDPPVSAVLDSLLGDALPSDVNDPTLDEACRCIDRLEGLAKDAPWGLRIGGAQDRDLARLRSDGLGHELVARLRDAGRSTHPKRLLLQIAEATESHEVVEAAIDLVRDRGQDDELRYEAVWFVATFGGRAHLESLAPDIAESTSEEEIECRLRGVLVSALLEQKVWAVWRAALHAPAPSRAIGDSRLTLQRTLSELMTLADARRLLPHLADLCERHDRADYYPDTFPPVVSRVIELVTTAAPPVEEDVNVLVTLASAWASRGARQWSQAREVVAKLRHVATARRRLYQHDRNSEVTGRAVQGLGAWNFLDPSDWTWLRDRARTEWRSNREVWGDAYWLTRLARDRRLLTESDWTEFITLVESHAPGLPAGFEEGEERARRLEADHQARRQAADRTGRRRRPLEERVRSILDNAGFDDATRMRELAYACFAKGIGFQAQAVGDWADLNEVLRASIMNVFARALAALKPTPIPEGNSYTLFMLAEGMAFERLALDTVPATALSADMVRKWLPSAMHARINGGWATLIRACRSSAPQATEQVLVSAINSFAGRFDRPFQLRHIPPDCWADSLTDQLAAVCGDASFAPVTRRELLEQMLERSPKRAAQIARAWVEGGSGGSHDELIIGGLSVLLVCRPEVAVELLESRFEQFGAVALSSLEPLFTWSGRVSTDWTRWPFELVVRVCRLVARGYPTADDPEDDGEGGAVSVEDELIQLRGSLISHLLGRPEEAAATALDGIGATDDRIRQWVHTHRASVKAAAALPEMDPRSRPSLHHVAVGDAVRLLEAAEFRLIRTVDDLFDSILVALEEIEADVGHDLPMLYSAPPGDGSGRTHLHEDALQSYLRRRLKDCLGRITREVDVAYSRESQVGRRQRLDLTVTAPCLGTRQLATVIVEIKWSDNAETRTALVDQLGTRYLLGEGKTHGIFLVGWCGKWIPGNRSIDNADVRTLRDHLNRQKTEYCQSGQQGERLRIEPFVLSVAWRAGQTQSASMA